MPILRMRDGQRIRVREGADYDASTKKYYGDRAAERRATPEFQEKLEAQRTADAAEYNPTNEMGTLERLAVGNTQGWARALRGAANMVGLQSDEETAAANETDKYLTDTTAGGVGSFVGNTAALTGATAPVGAGLGATVKALGATGRLGATLGGGAGNVAVQGALGGAINADPGEREQGAVVGGALGAGTYGVLKGAGRLASGLVKLDPDAALLQQRLGVHIPLSSAASTDDAISRAAKVGYELAEASPISGAIIQAQRSQVDDALVSQMADDLVPKNLGVSPQFTAGRTPAARDLNRRAVSDVLDAIEQTVGPLKQVRVEVSMAPKKMWAETVQKAVDKLAKSNQKLGGQVRNIIDREIGRGVSETNLGQLLKLKAALKAVRSKMGGTANTGSGADLDKIIAAIDDLGTRRLSVMNKKLLPNWQRANKLFDDEYWGWMRFRGGMTPQGEFTPASIAEGIEKGANASSLQQGLVPGQELGQLAKRVLVDETSNAPGYFKSAIGTGAGLASIMGGGVPGAVAFGVGMPLASTVTGQRMLSGQTGVQRAIAEAIRNNPNLLRDIAARGTNALTPEGQ